MLLLYQQLLTILKLIIKKRSEYNVEKERNGGVILNKSNKSPVQNVINEVVEISNEMPSNDSNIIIKDRTN